MKKKKKKGIQIGKSLCYRILRFTLRLSLNSFGIGIRINIFKMQCLSKPKIEKDDTNLGKNNMIKEF